MHSSNIGAIPISYRFSEDVKIIKIMSKNAIFKPQSQQGKSHRNDLSEMLDFKLNTDEAELNWII